MISYDSEEVGRIIQKIDENEKIFNGYRLCEYEGRPKLLGSGGFSYVFEMYEEERPEIRYALKVMGLNEHTLSSEAFSENIELQRNIADSTRHVVKIISAAERQINLEECKAGDNTSSPDKEKKGRIKDAFRYLAGMKKDSIPVEKNEIKLQFLLMEKLECVLIKKKNDEVSLVREELKETREAIRLMMDISDAVAASHKARVLHRDIKLENIFWDGKAGVYKLGDFGTAKYTLSGVAETIVCTDGYRAPEIQQILEEVYDATSDIYSLGITFFLLLNELKFPGSDKYRALKIQYDKDYVMPAPSKSDDALAAIVRKMCSYRKVNRYQSVDEIIKAIEAYEKMRDAKLEAPDDEEFYDSGLTAMVENRCAKDSAHSALNGRSDRAFVKRGPKSLELLWRQRVLEYYEWTEHFYFKKSIYFLLIVSASFVMILKGIGGEDEYLRRWEYWTFVIAIMLEGIFIVVKDMQILFGVVSAVAMVYSIYAVGFHPAHFLVIVSFSFGVTALMEASVTGVTVWSVLTVAGEDEWMNFVVNLDLTWAFISLTLFMFYSYTLNRSRCQKEQLIAERLYVNYYMFFLIILVSIGAAELILKIIGVIDAVPVLSEIHLFRVGLACMIAKAVTQKTM